MTKKKDIIVFWVATEADVKLAEKLLARHDKNCNYLIFIRTPQKKWRLRFFACSPGLESAVNINHEFGGVAGIWEALDSSGRWENYLEAKLNNATLPEDCLKHLISYCEQNNIKKGISSYIYYTDAYFVYAAKEQRDVVDGHFDFVGPQKSDIEFFRKNGDYEAVPKVFMVNCHTSCNKHCAKCLYHSPDSPYLERIPSNRFMSFDQIKKLIDELSSLDPKPHFFPNMSGEPLMNPELYNILEYARDKEVLFSLSTNGDLLTREKARKLLDVGCGSILVSLDTLDSDLYKKKQAPGKLSATIENINNLLEMKNDYDTKVGLTYVCDEENIGEFEEFLKFWKNKCDSVVKSIKCRLDTHGLALPPFHDPGEKIPCHHPWQDMVVHHDGRLVVCGLDMFADTINMDINDISIYKVWNSPKARKFREDTVANPMMFQFCKACPIWMGSKIWSYEKDGQRVTCSPLATVYERIQS